MQLERRALYNSLRLNWLMDPQVRVEPWQVEDYRLWSSEQLFQALKKYGLQVDRASFIPLADEWDSPEEFTDRLIEEKGLEVSVQDEIYLLMFELWRRLVPEKQSISVFCDELDHQIYIYDTGEALSAESIEDMLANLKVILDENVDNGADPIEAFQTISTGCANDIESFIYDFISTQIDEHNISYASELIDFFNDYIEDERGFDLLRTRVMADSDPKAAEILVAQIIEDAKEDPDFEFNLEVLSFLAKEGNKPLFFNMVKQTLPIIKTEADFQDLLLVCGQYFHFLDDDEREQTLQKMLAQRDANRTDRQFHTTDPAIQELIRHLLS